MSMELEDLRVTPEEPGERQRFWELEEACRNIVNRLPAQEQKLFREYWRLLDRKNDRLLLSAYQSGIQVGQRRVRREKEQ